MSSLERRYFNHLELLKSTGKILDFWFEPFNLRLAQKTYYRPDFLVMMPDCELEVHETKGFMMDDANVKIKVAAAKFPFKFKVIRLIKGEWVTQEIAE